MQLRIYFKSLMNRPIVFRNSLIGIVEMAFL